MKQIHVILVLSVLLVAVTSITIIREMVHRAYEEELELKSALFYARAEHVIDSLTNVNVLLKNEAIEATSAANAIVEAATDAQYKKDRAAIPSASDSELKDIILWRQPARR